MSVSPFQVRDWMYAWATSCLEQCKEWQLCVQFVCTYIWKVYYMYLHSFQVSCDVLSSMITIVKFCLPVISLVIKMNVFHCVGVYWGSPGTRLLKFHEACSPTLPYRCQLMQQLLHDDAYLKQMWQTAIQWLQYEMEKVCYGKLFIQNTIVYTCCWQAVLINCSLNHPLIL